eukprot:g225.t1
MISATDSDTSSTFVYKGQRTPGSYASPYQPKTPIIQEGRTKLTEARPGDAKTAFTIPHALQKPKILFISTGGTISMVPATTNQRLPPATMSRNSGNTTHHKSSSVTSRSSSIAETNPPPALSTSPPPSLSTSPPRPRFNRRGSVTSLPSNTTPVENTGPLRPYSTPGHIRRLLNDIPSLNSDSMPDYDVLEYFPPIDSCDMNLSVYDRLCNDIASRYFDFDGFVILHGTDTIVNTACALSFMMENLNKPVILTGSMVPSFHAHNDVSRNVISAALFAGYADIPEVAICFADTLYRGNRCIKRSSCHLDAFESPNYPILAKIDTDITIKEKYIMPQPNRRFRVWPLRMDLSVSVVWLIPGFAEQTAVMLEAYVRDDHSRSLHGLVMCAYGSGNLPMDNHLYTTLKKLRDRGCVIVVTSQCRKGSVNMSLYETGAKLRAAGAVSAFDMTTEAATAKLSFLLALGLKDEEIRYSFQQDLRGEVTVPQKKNYSEGFRQRNSNYF